MSHFIQSLVMVQSWYKNCLIIGEHVVFIFVGDTIGHNNNTLTYQGTLYL